MRSAAVIGAGIALGAYGLSRLFRSSAPQPELAPTPASTFTSPVAAPWEWSKEGYHYISLGENVQCQVCPNKCILREGVRSVCRNKINYKGKLYTLAYGNPCAIHVDPVEKKPLFHFLPSTTAFSMATAGCNFRCMNCQNWEISQKSPEETENITLYPQEVVQHAEESGCKSIAYTYSEPTAWYEYMYDTSQVARSQGMKNLWITNGYMNEPPLRDLCQYLDAANVDVKSFREDIYNTLNAGTLEPVLHTLKVLKEEGVWFEVTNLVIPTWTDDLDMIREMCVWLYTNVGPEYPLHFSRFYPAYRLLSLPQTPYDTLKEARKIAMDEGLYYVYIGNVPGEEENTYCPSCGKLLIERKGFSVVTMLVEEGVCTYCGQPIKGVWT